LCEEIRRTGRSTGVRKTNSRTRINGQFVPHRLDLIQSPAWAALSLAARRVLDRIEAEHVLHGGADNGRLAVPYRALEEGGVRPNSITAAIREAVALGFLRITRPGRGGNREFRQPTLYRLTHLPTRDMPPTDEWTSITTDVQADEIARAARSGKQKSPPKSGGETALRNGGRNDRKPRPPNRRVLSIYRRGAGRLGDDNPARATRDGPRRTHRLRAAPR
jgi:hypothetical protein